MTQVKHHIINSKIRFKKKKLILDKIVKVVKERKKQFGTQIAWIFIPLFLI